MASVRKPTLGTAGTYHFFNKNTSLNESIFKIVHEGTVLPIEHLVPLDTYRKYRYEQREGILRLLKDNEIKLLFSDKPTLKLTVALPSITAVKNGEVNTYVNVSNYAKKITDTEYRIDDRVLFSLLTAGYIEYIWHHYYSIVMRRGVDFFRLLASNYAEAMVKVFNRLYSIGTNPTDVEKIRYFSAKFALNYMLGLDELTSREIATVAANSTAAFVSVIDQTEYDFNNSQTDSLTYLMSAIAQNVRTINVSETAIIETWLKMYGQSAAFALDYMPAYLTMLANASVGAYLNNQKSIESLLKFGGDKLLIQYYAAFR